MVPTKNLLAFLLLLLASSVSMHADMPVSGVPVNSANTAYALNEGAPVVVTDSLHVAPVVPQPLALLPGANNKQELIASAIGGGQICVLVSLFIDWALTNPETRKAAVPLHIAAAGISLICYLGHFGKLAPQTYGERKASAVGAIIALICYCALRQEYRFGDQNQNKNIVKN